MPGNAAHTPPAGRDTNGSGEDVLNGKACVKDKTGLDVTREFLSGAQKALQIAKKKGANYAILKARSPSCGCGEIYDGTFSGGKNTATAWQQSF